MRLKGQRRRKMLPGTEAPVTAMTLPSAESRRVSWSQHVNLHSNKETLPTVQILISGSHIISLGSLNLSLAPQVEQQMFISNMRNTGNIRQTVK